MYPLSVFLLALILAFSSATNIPAQTPDEALFQAVEINDMDAVEAAITAGADLAAKNANDMTPADVAVDLDHFRIAHVLLAKRTANASSAPRVTDKGKRPLSRHAPVLRQIAHDKQRPPPSDPTQNYLIWYHLKNPYLPRPPRWSHQALFHRV